MASPGQARVCLDAAALVPGCVIPGPFGVVLRRLQAVGVQWLPEVQEFNDYLGRWSPWHVCSQELQLRLAYMWQQRVAADLQHRPGFAAKKQMTGAHKIIHARARYLKAHVTQGLLKLHQSRWTSSPRMASLYGCKHLQPRHRTPDSVL